MRLARVARDDVMAAMDRYACLIDNVHLPAGLSPRVSSSDSRKLDIKVWICL